MMALIAALILKSSLNIGSLPMAGSPSMALRIQTFNYHGSFSRYTPCHKRAHSVPIMHKRCADIDNYCRLKKSKSESYMDETIPEPLTRDGTYTFDYRTLTFGS